MGEKISQSRLQCGTTSLSHVQKELTGYCHNSYGSLNRRFLWTELAWFKRFGMREARMYGIIKGKTAIRIEARQCKSRQYVPSRLD